ncbi:MAG: deoxyribodipyrimidine photolyase [Planctomycetales bacterium]|nr:deoxyribodipyrimidine photolyase [Planctomycetales bacterium]
MPEDLPIGEVPAIRIVNVNQQPYRADGQFVLYWMIANRRTKYNFSLDRAIDWAKHLKKPLVVLEALRCDYRWASDRIHQFVIDGMMDNAKAFANHPVTYYCYLEPRRDAGNGLLQALAADACMIVTDDFPCFFLPRMVKAAAQRIHVRVEAVDSNGLLPMRATDKVFARAFDFRRFLQKNLLPHLENVPQPKPLQRLQLPKYSLPKALTDRWHCLSATELKQFDLAALHIDHAVKVVPDLPGGTLAAEKRWKRFVDNSLSAYGTRRNEPEEDVASGLSPYLHFGHISAHEIFDQLMASESWSPGKVSSKTTGSSSGWWGTSESAESFLDELITWREVGYNMCCLNPDYDKYASLPNWAQQTLEEHAGDRRDYEYSLSEFELAQTHDPLWNAAQNQLVQNGIIHNYLRMLWGKKILEWTPSPQMALEVMIELNNKYALDGRNPNSYSGIFWVLGRYDRAWGPERPVFGKIRFMSSDNTARKVKVKNYIRKYTSREQRLF